MWWEIGAFVLGVTLPLVGGIIIEFWERRNW